MKNILLFLTLCIISVTALHAQMVVTDPVATKVATTGWAKTLTESLAQGKTLVETKKILESSIDIYSKVSGTLQNVEAIKNMIDRQVNMFSIISKELRRTDVKDISLYKAHIRNIEALLSQTQSTVRLVNQVLSSAMKMDEGQRLSIILELDKQTSDLEKKLKSRVNKFSKLNRMLKPLYMLREMK